MLETPENRGSEGPKSTKTPILCSVICSNAIAGQAAASLSIGYLHPGQAAALSPIGYLHPGQAAALSPIGYLHPGQAAALSSIGYLHLGHAIASFGGDTEVA